MRRLPIAAERVSLAAALIGLLSAGPVMAQDSLGLVGGLSLGAGRLSTTGSSSSAGLGIVRVDAENGPGVAGDLYLGAGRPGRDALLFELALLSRDYSVPTEGELRVDAERVIFATFATSQTAYTIVGSYQKWLAHRLWLKAGLGVGTLDRDISMEAADLTLSVSKGYGFAVTVAAGFDLPAIWHHPRETTDVRVRYTTFAVGRVRVHAPSVQVGFTWH